MTSSVPLYVPTSLATSPPTLALFIWKPAVTGAGRGMDVVVGCGLGSPGDPFEQGVALAMVMAEGPEADEEERRGLCTLWGLLALLARAIVLKDEAREPTEAAGGGGAAVMFCIDAPKWRSPARPPLEM